MTSKAFGRWVVVAVCIFFCGRGGAESLLYEIECPDAGTVGSGENLFGSGFALTDRYLMTGIRRSDQQSSEPGRIHVYDLQTSNLATLDLPHNENMVFHPGIKCAAAAGRGYFPGGAGVVAINLADAQELFQIENPNDFPQLPNGAVSDFPSELLATDVGLFVSDVTVPNAGIGYRYGTVYTFSHGGQLLKTTPDPHGLDSGFFGRHLYSAGSGFIAYTKSHMGFLYSGVLHLVNGKSGKAGKPITTPYIPTSPFGEGIASDGKVIFAPVGTESIVCLTKAGKPRFQINTYDSFSVGKLALVNGVLYSSPADWTVGTLPARKIKKYDARTGEAIGVIEGPNGVSFTSEIAASAAYLVVRGIRYTEQGASSRLFVYARD